MKNYIVRIARTETTIYEKQAEKLAYDDYETNCHEGEIVWAEEDTQEISELELDGDANIQAIKQINKQARELL
jgi:hypothetical protein